MIFPSFEPGCCCHLALVNPAIAMVRHILQTMADQGNNMFFSLNPDDAVTAFRSELAANDLAGLHLPIIQKATTTPQQYEAVLRSFRRKPNPPGIVMQWICRHNPDYLYLDENAISMRPAGQRPTGRSA